MTTTDSQGPVLAAPVLTTPVLIARTGPTVRITLNRPDRYNAIDEALAAQFRSAVEAVAADPEVRVVVLQGAGRAFCAGGDVLDMASAEAPGEYLRQLATTIHAALEQLATLPVVVVAAVRGAAAGGGLGLMLACDLIVAGEGATFSAAYGKVGLTPDCGLSTRLPEAIGMQRALAMAVGGKTLTANQALDWGLVTDVVPDESLEARAEELVAAILAEAPRALGGARQLLRAARRSPFSDALAAEAETIGLHGEHEEARRLTAAFAARRKRG
ncbi:MAG: enoyl-CoA hydratase/isomerase family protein [Segniliparus sp.]|uniref:enoyl-CoA hydratase/isomerase family protein n=1 Tax=Segniliparus sp. TaxID=2804064 RepID=UPI003F392CBD